MHSTGNCFTGNITAPDHTAETSIAGEIPSCIPFSRSEQQIPECSASRATGESAVEKVDTFPAARMATWAWVDTSLTDTCDTHFRRRPSTLKQRISGSRCFGVAPHTPMGRGAPMSQLSSQGRRKIFR